MPDDQRLFPIEGLLNFKRDTYENTISNKYPLGGLLTTMWEEGKLPFVPSPRGLPSSGLLYMMTKDPAYKDLSKFGYVSWDENTDYEYDEEGNEAPGEPYALIERTEVYPQFRRKGYGKRLVREAIKEIQAEKPGLEIKLVPHALDKESGGLDDEQLGKFYESLGFAADESSPIGAMIYEGPDLEQD